MSIAVLKNRLLDLTERRFDESRWGAASMREFVELFGDLLDLDTSKHPASVTLRSDVDLESYTAVATAEPARTRGEWRIRQDLWEAVVDCVSGYAYVWDGARAVAMDPEDLPADDPRLLPTVSREELTGWRQDFAEEALVGTEGKLREEIERWRDESLSSQNLPPRLRNRWYGVMKRHVRARLDEWFAKRAESPPADGIVSPAVQRVVPSEDTEHLRSVILRAVRQMTRAELEATSLPASVVARLAR